MTYNDIKQRVYDILDMPMPEILRVGYTSKIHRIFNEATFRIAHSVLPNLREYRITISVDKLPAKLIMPPDFISFADEQNAYVNGKNFVLTEFIDRNAVILSGDEGGVDSSDIRTYTLYYNALYPEIIDGGKKYRFVHFIDTIDADGYEICTEPTEVMHNDDDTSYDWPQIIGQLVPHYIAGQLLANDDKTRSITELNSFETLLATVNVDRNERQRTYRSVRGWY